MAEEKWFTNRERFEYLREDLKSSSDDFEKYLNYVSAGTLVLSVTIVEKITPLADASDKGLLFFSWFFLVAALVIQIFSHNKSADITLEHMHKIVHLEPEDKLENWLLDQGKTMKRINKGALLSMILGILCLVMYSTINAMTPQSVKTVFQEEKRPMTPDAGKAKVPNYFPVNPPSPPVTTPQVTPPPPPPPSNPNTQ